MMKNFRMLSVPFIFAILFIPVIICAQENYGFDESDFAFGESGFGFAGVSVSL